jgi:hypothetical protein
MLAGRVTDGTLVPGRRRKIPPAAVMLAAATFLFV